MEWRNINGSGKKSFTTEESVWIKETNAVLRVKELKEIYKVYDAIIECGQIPMRMKASDEE